MKKSMLIGVQIYILKDHLTTRQDISASLKKLKTIGLEHVEVYSLEPVVSDSDFAQMLKDEGLSCLAFHSRMIFDAPEKLVETLALFDCSYIVYPWPYTDPQNEADYKRLGQKLDVAGAMFAKAGKTLLYHNHAKEFERFGNRCALEIIYEETDPANLKAELDTYWIQYGGGNPVAWCSRLKGRLSIVHAKDLGIINNQIKFMEVGSGNLDWAGIIKAAKNSGCKALVIEQDSCPGNAFDSVKKSFDFLSGVI
ncbi:MAG: Xylose isomerase-like TIM barrel [Smithella sp. PtaU1.Bin162]|nr:MAG: Xylose isomerase-like TIM barrel [Smithella sp. PtaU1.Bin162]